MKMKEGKPMTKPTAELIAELRHKAKWAVTPTQEAEYNAWADRLAEQEAIIEKAREIISRTVPWNETDATLIIEFEKALQPTTEAFQDNPLTDNPSAEVK
jgi:hypothetical protein